MRLLDFFHLGLGYSPREEFCALDDISFEVAGGATVGIIGRNGAGKSTLLRILAGNTVPTSGDIRLNGKVSALLELGTGFHPELTGEENIYVSAMYSGMTREQVASVYADIVAFSELEDFIRQPVKTYSSGMYMRLAFAISTCIDPDILVIDEVLSVGDAYFSRKCYERIRALTERGKTVLIVSHDLAAVQRLCKRVLWIDHGRLVMDGPTLEVLRAYAASIRAQEESRINRQSAAFSQSEETFRRKGLISGSGEVEITAVTFLNRYGKEQHIFEAGEPFSIRVHYLAHKPVRQPVFAVSLYRSDGVTIVQAISSFDQMDFGTINGQGYGELLFDPAVIGAGEYVVSIAILPWIDPLDRILPEPYVRHSQLYEFRIEPQPGCVFDLGVVRQAVRWRGSGQNSEGQAGHDR
jgi:lipopolysaccharide transport system ATP-binding protein